MFKGRASSARRRFLVPAALALILLSAGCATTPASTPVLGSASDVSRLAGEWSGEYWGASNGRSGVIEFHLEAGADTAHGQVTMINRNANLGREARGGVSPPATGEPMAQELTITFVQAEGGGVSGRLDPYTDPECNCTATTTFAGRIRDDVIEGTFMTSHDAGSRTTGKWKVKRKKA